MNKASFIPDEKMHTGHRERIRSKLLKHGPRIFDTYELLEMLLYYSIPHKDTNPIAKRLLSERGSLDSVLSSSDDELMSVSGVGECTARLITAVDCLNDALFLDRFSEHVVFNNYDRTGAFLARKLAETNEKKILLLLLDNSMRMLDLVTVYEGVDYGTVAVKPRDFINAAILSGASVVITAHNHPFGPLAESMSDRETNKLLDRAFSAAGITVLEHYVTVGDSYVGSDFYCRSTVNTATEIDRFIKSKESSLLNALSPEVVE